MSAWERSLAWLVAPAVNAHDVALRAAIFCAGWSLLLIVFMLLLPNKSFEYTNRLVSIAHAVLCVVMFAPDVMQGQWSGYAAPNDLKTTWKVLVCVGYFIYDTACVPFLDDKLANLFHHMTGIYCAAINLAMGHGIRMFTACMGCMELSTPFLHLRGILREEGLRDHWAFTAVEAAFAAIFVYTRGPFATLSLVTALQLYWQGRITVWQLLPGVILWLVSTVWLFKVVRILVATFTGARSKRAQKAPDSSKPPAKVAKAA